MTELRYGWVNPNETYVLVQPFADETPAQREGLRASLSNGYDTANPAHAASDGRGIFQGINRREVCIELGMTMYIAIHEDVDPEDLDTAKERSEKIEFSKYIGRNFNKAEWEERVKNVILDPQYKDYTTDRIAAIVGVTSLTLRSRRDKYDPNHINRETIGVRGIRKPVSERKVREKEDRDYGVEHLQTGIKSVINNPNILNCIPEEQMKEFIETLSAQQFIHNHNWTQTEQGDIAEDAVAEILESLGFVDETANFKGKNYSGKFEYSFVRQYNEPLSWGGIGRQDFLVRIKDENTAQEFMVEVRSQDEEASSPFGRNLETWERFINSEIQNWVLVVTGDYWRRHEGHLSYLAAKKYPAGKNFIIIKGLEDFRSYAKTWGSK